MRRALPVEELQQGSWHLCSLCTLSWLSGRLDRALCAPLGRHLRSQAQKSVDHRSERLLCSVAALCTRRCAEVVDVWSPTSACEDARALNDCTHTGPWDS